MCVATFGTNVDNSLQPGIILFSQYNIEKKANDEDEDDDDSDFEGSKKAVEEDLDGLACKFAHLYDRLLCQITTGNRKYKNKSGRK